MRSSRVQPFVRLPLARAFTVVELLVAVSVLSLIVLVLYGLFDQVQKALRGNVAQVDVLEGGRTSMQLLSGEMEQMGAGNVPGSTNLFISMTAPPSQQAMLDPGTNRVNLLDQVFFVSHLNKTWTGTGYRVLSLNTNGTPMALAERGVGTLCRYAVSVNDSDFPNLPVRPGAPGPINVFWQVMNRPLDPPLSNLTNYQPVVDGVVHFRVRAFDTNGFPMTYLTNNFSYVIMGYDLLNLAPRGSPAAETTNLFTTSALPAYLEVEMGTLEPHKLEQFKAFPSPIVASNYLARQVGAVHLFQQRIPIHTAK